MSDVTALVLSVGEAYTERAIASVGLQSMPVAEIIVVRGVTPFHRAFNDGVVRVRTPFFLQVDADMMLDETCIADLRACIADGVGMVVGHLRDPLLGRVVGIKLFRTACFAAARFQDSISPDTDFGQAMLRCGWTDVYGLRYAGALRDGWHCFGEHRPDYTPLYTYGKYSIGGARLRYRNAGAGARGLFRLLHHSAHPAATLAVIATAHGIFATDQRDLLRPYARTADFELLERFLNAPALGEDGPALPESVVHEDLMQEFKRAYRLGIRLRRQQARSAFTRYMKQLQDQQSISAWVALVGLCHGLFVDDYAEAGAQAAFALLQDLLPG